VGAWGTIVPWLPPSTTDEVGAGPGSPRVCPGKNQVQPYPYIQQTYFIRVASLRVP